MLVLGLEASEEDLDRSFRIAAPHPICRGFAVGRSIFADAAAAWFAGRMSDDEVIADIAGRYARLIALLGRGARRRGRSSQRDHF